MDPPWPSPCAPEPLLLPEQLLFLEEDDPPDDPACLGALVPPSPAPDSPSACAIERLLEAFSACDDLGACAGALGPVWEGGLESGQPSQDWQQGQRRLSAHGCAAAAPAQAPQSYLESAAHVAGPAPPYEAPRPHAASLLHGPYGAGAAEHQNPPSGSTAAAARPRAPPPADASWFGTGSTGLPPPHPAPHAPSAAPLQPIAAWNPGPHAVKLLEIPVPAPSKQTAKPRSVSLHPPFQPKGQGSVLQGDLGAAGAGTHPICASILTAEGSSPGALRGALRLLRESLSSSRTKSEGSDAAMSLPREPDAAGAPASLRLQLPEPKACSCVTVGPADGSARLEGAPAAGPESKEQMLMWIKGVVQEAIRSLHAPTAEQAVLVEASASSSRMPCKQEDNPESKSMSCRGIDARASHSSAGQPSGFNRGSALAEDVSCSKREDYGPRTPVKEEASAAREDALEGFPLEARSCGDVTRNNDNQNIPHDVDSSAVGMLSAGSRPWTGACPFNQNNLLPKSAGPGLSAEPGPREANQNSGEPLTSGSQASSRMHKWGDSESTAHVRRAGVRSRLRPPDPATQEHAELARAEASADKCGDASQEEEGSGNVQHSTETDEAHKPADQGQRPRKDKGKRMIHLLEEGKAAAKNEGERRRRSKIMSAYKRLRLELHYDGEVHGMLAEAASIIKCQQERINELQQKIASGPILESLPSQHC